MKLITKPEELVVGKWYWFTNKTRNSIARLELLGYSELSLEYHDIIECATPTAEDFDRLILQHNQGE